MPPISPGILIRSGALAIGLHVMLVCNAQADARATDRMESELCACMTMIDQRLGDRAFEMRVRGCLENAVVHHPAAIRTLLQRDASGDNKGYQVGLLLGRDLEDRCPAFRPVQQRLRRINADSALLKSAS